MPNTQKDWADKSWLNSEPDAFTVITDSAAFLGLIGLGLFVLLFAPYIFDNVKVCS